jgi:hypothetical protein
MEQVRPTIDTAPEYMQSPRSPLIQQSISGVRSAIPSSARNCHSKPVSLLSVNPGICRFSGYLQEITDKVTVDVTGIVEQRDNGTCFLKFSGLRFRNDENACMEIECLDKFMVQFVSKELELPIDCNCGDLEVIPVGQVSLVERIVIELKLSPEIVVHIEGSLSWNNNAPIAEA